MLCTVLFYDPAWCSVFVLLMTTGSIERVRICQQEAEQCPVTGERVHVTH